jgi:predicted amidohydrolase YtcJ
MLPIVALPGLLVLSLAASLPPEQQADLIVENATIYTVNKDQPKVRALAVKQGRILAVGEDVSAYAGPATERLDLHGATVVPGLVDSHAHLEGLGSLLESADLRHVRTVAEVAEYVRTQAAQRKPGEWIVGRNWDQTNWGGQFPSARDLDQSAPDNPVFLSRVDGHAGWANSAALKLAGVTAETHEPSGGRIIKDDSGQPTGIFVDKAMALIQSKIPAPTAGQVQRRLELGARECARLGLTTVHDAGVSKMDLNAYRALIAGDKLPIRVYAMIGGTGELWREYLSKGPEVGEQLSVRSIKLYADGALGSRGAALWQPYTDDPGNSGLLMTTKEEIANVAREALAHGFQVCTHAIGDRANRTVLDAYAAALKGPNDKRFRIEHAQVISLPDFQLFKDFSILPAMQSTHATSDMRWIEQRVGPDRVAGAYAWQRFLKLGIRVANGSDFPVEEPNPMLGLYAAVTRQDLEGNPPGGWTPSQRMTRTEALESWTLSGAYAAFEEKSKGTLETGKLADFIVLDRDIMTVPELLIPGTRVLKTFLGGKLVHEIK